MDTKIKLIINVLTSQKKKICHAIIVFETLTIFLKPWQIGAEGSLDIKRGNEFTAS